MLSFQTKSTVALSASPSVAPAARRDIVAEMADKMLVLGMNGIAADADNLGEDFTQAEIEANWRDARDRARGRAIRQAS